MDDRTCPDVLSAAVYQHGDQSSDNHGLEGMVNESFVDDGVTEHSVVLMAADAFASEANMDVDDCRTGEDVAQCSSSVDAADMEAGDSRSTSSSVDEVKMVDVSTGRHTASSDAMRTMNDVSAMRSSPDDDQLHDVSVFVCPVDHNVPTSPVSNVRDTTDHCRTVSHCMNSAQTTAVSDSSGVLPSYTASITNCQPVVRHQTATLSSLRRHRKLCAECCLHCVVMATSLRFLLVAIVLIGAGSMAGGIALGAVSMSAGNDYFTLSAVFVGQFQLHLILLTLM